MMDINAYLDGAEDMHNGQVCDNCKHWTRVGMKPGLCRRYPPIVIFDTVIKGPAVS